MTKTIGVEGMSCMHCVNRVKEALEEIDAVQQADVSLDDKKAVVHLHQNIANDLLTEAIADAGYNVTRIEE